MQRIHTLTDTSSGSTAQVQELDNEFTILDGWNMGQITAEIRFPNLNTARTYCAGRWNTPLSKVVLTSTREIKPVLTVEEKIVKLAKQLARGIVTDGEFMSMMDVLIDQEWEQAFKEGNQN